MGGGRCLYEVGALRKGLGRVQGGEASPFLQGGQRLAVPPGHSEEPQLPSIREPSRVPVSSVDTQPFPLVDNGRVHQMH